MENVPRFDIIPEVMAEHRCFSSPEPGNFLMHVHNANEILYFINGDATYMVEGNEYKLRPGCIMLMMHNESHMLKLRSEVTYERTVLHFADNFWDIPELPSIVEPLLQKPMGLCNCFDPDPDFKVYTNACLKCSEKGDIVGMKANMLALIILLRDKYLSGEQNIPAYDTSDLRSIIEYINANLYSDLTLDSICARFFVNKSQLNRRFKEIAGSTVWDYIIIKRLFRARELIKSGMKTNAAAEAAGFHDYSNFYRSYRSHFKVSPKLDCRK